MLQPRDQQMLQPQFAASYRQRWRQEIEQLNAGVETWQP